MHSREHVISLVLSNEEWKAFVQAQPEPVTWLKQQIQERIAAAGTPAPQTIAPKAVSLV